MNNTVSVGGIFCDLEKACNCINHRILLDKLDFLGLFGNFFCYNTTVITCTSATSATVINYALLFHV